MIKAIDSIPKEANKTNRTKAVKEDLRAALYERVPQFELVGDMYKVGGAYTTSLSKSLVRECAYGAVVEYIWTMSRIRGCDPIGMDTSTSVKELFKTFRVHSYQGRIFVEIDFGLIDELIDRRCGNHE